MRYTIFIALTLLLPAACEDNDAGALVQMQSARHSARVHMSSALRVDLRLGSEDSDGGGDFMTTVPHVKGAPEVQRWYPTSISGTGEGVRVHLTSFSNAKHSQLLKEDERYIQSEAGHRRDVPLMQFIHEETGNVPKSLFLSYKVARCGSTLLDSMLAKDPRFLLVSEPQVMNQVAGAIPGDGEQEKRLRRELYRALVFKLATPITEQQSVSFLDFNSQTSKVLQEVTNAVPEAHSLLLWRKPIEAADSLYTKPPGWLSMMVRANNTANTNPNQTKLWAIEHHMENVINGLKGTKAEVPVFWYQQVPNGILPRWIVDHAFNGVTEDDEEKVQEMMVASQVDAKTGKPWPAGKIDHNELTVDPAEKEVGVVWYNPTLVDFGAKLNPIIAQKHTIGGNVRELRWPEDKAKIEEALRGKDRHFPVLIRNALASTEFGGKSTEEMYQLVRKAQEAEGPQEDSNSRRRIVHTLEAEKENSFIWHSKFNQERSHYHVLSKWSHATWDEFEKDPKTQVIDHLPSTIGDKLVTNTSLLSLIPESAQAHGLGGLSLRISHQGAITALHYDCGDSALWQLGGAKEIILWPQSELQSLYPYGRDHFMFRRTLADPEHMDPVNLPNFSLSKALYARPGPGDFIFWPSQWAHHIRTVEGPSISAGIRWNWPEDKFGFPDGAPEELISKVESLRYAKGFKTDGADAKSASAIKASMLQANSKLKNDDDDDNAWSA